ncbi:MAG: HRDC domain-containing protein [Pirellulaceae bacterium]|jgi:ribonuclease D|nr:ribonuclease D [Planctomycetaceae bacterium]HIM29091.1 ribonuclease D [Planctomycetota bacterium]
MVHYEHIDSDEQLAVYCKKLAQCDRVAFDTEFVSEDTYRPELCLVQVASDVGLAIIDPLCLDIRSFWQVLLQQDIETTVHAGREEYRFLRFATDAHPSQWYDVQIAAGMIGCDYPASYASLVSKLLGQTIPKGETRTDWRKRPLSKRQLDYAAKDVVYLFPLRDAIGKKLEQLNRSTWNLEELDRWQRQQDEDAVTERWRRVSSISQLSPRGLAIAREIWRWRESEAKSRNQPPKRVLRDDLIVEIARRELASPDQVRAIRGMERRGLQKAVGAIADAVNKGLAVPKDDCPVRGKSSRPPLTLIGQFLATALSSVCRDAKVAPSLVGGAEAVRDLVAYQLNVAKSNTVVPSLASGWRADLVGNALTEVLEGKKAIKVDEALSDQPLSFVDLEP